jgi:hypothetical protein
MESFKKFQPNSEKKLLKKNVIDEVRDFSFNPRKFYC